MSGIEKKVSDKISVISDKTTALDRLREIEEHIHEECLNVVGSVIGFADIDPKNDEPPQEWVDTFGYEQAYKKYRLACAGWMSAKEAPVGIKVASITLNAIIKARSDEKTKQPLNIALIKMNIDMPEYECIEVDE